MLIHEITHIVLSCLAGGVVALYFKKWYCVLAALLTGFLVDADHLVDYWLFKKEFTFGLAEFVKGNYFGLAGKVIIPFHAYEYVVLLIFLGFVFVRLNRRVVLGGLMLAAGLSLFLHLGYDTIEYRPKWQTYSIIYRAYSGFDIEKFDFGSLGK